MGASEGVWLEGSPTSVLISPAEAGETGASGRLSDSGKLEPGSHFPEVDACLGVLGGRTEIGEERSLCL